MGKDEERLRPDFALLLFAQLSPPSPGHITHSLTHSLTQSSLNPICQVGLLGLASWLLILPAAFLICSFFIDGSIVYKESLFYPLMVGGGGAFIARVLD